MGWNRFSCFNISAFLSMLDGFVIRVDAIANRSRHALKAGVPEASKKQRPAPVDGHLGVIVEGL